jgi:hypothetical protein
MQQPSSAQTTAPIRAVPSRTVSEIGFGDRDARDVGGMSIIETGRFLGIGRSLTFSEIRAGRLKARKIGRRTIVNREDAVAYLRSLPIAGAAA